MIRMRSTTCLFALLAVALLPAAHALAGGGKDYADVTERWMNAYNAGDAAGVAALYTENGVAMPPNAPAVEGRAAIAAFLEGELAGNTGTLTIRTTEHGQSGDLGFARGTWSMTDASGVVVDSGKWMEVRKRVKGTWYIHADTWNSDMPRAAE